MSVRFTLAELAKSALPPQPRILNGQPEQPKGEKRTKARKPREKKQSESQMQSECVAWFRETYPQYAKLFWANPNGGYRSPKTAAILKREGVLSGVPDCTLAVPQKSYHGLYLELKRKGNKPTPNQVEVMALLTEQGYRCEVVYSTEQFKAAVQNYLGF